MSRTESVAAKRFDSAAHVGAFGLLLKKNEPLGTLNTVSVLDGSFGSLPLLALRTLPELVGIHGDLSRLIFKISL
jgi:hypothetical protein